MTWLTPLTGVFLAAAVIPPLILLYFLKLRRKQHPIPSTLLWQTSVEDMQANAPFQRLRWSLLLLLQLLVLLLLILSVMQPRVALSANRGGKTVLMIDNSASMGATDLTGGGTRLDHAKQRARDAIERIYSGGWLSQSPGETMIIAFSDRAQIMSRFTDSKADLLRAIDSIEQTHGETRLEDALKLARAYTTNVVDPDSGEFRPIADAPTIELFSDGGIADLDRQVLRDERMIYHAIGAATADNVAITAISVDRPFDRPTNIEVFVSLANFTTVERRCDIQLSVNGTALGIQETRIASAQQSPIDGMLTPGRANVVFSPFEQPRDAIIEVANLSEDHLAADNVASIVVPPPRRLRVALVNQRSELLLWVLQGLNLQSIEIMSASRFNAIAATGAASDFDVVVLHDYVPESLPDGRYLIFGAIPPLAGFNEFGEGSNQVILTAREEHPAMRFVALDNVFIARFMKIAPGEEVQVIAEGSDSPAIVEYARGPLALLCVTFDPLDSSWPFQRSFVTFVFNAIEYLGHRGEELASRGYRPGDALSARLPSGASSLQLLLPDGRSISTNTPDPTQFAWGPATIAGVYLLSWTEPGHTERRQRTFAVNLLSNTEGSLAVPRELKLSGSEKIAAAGEAASAYTPLWPFAVGLTLFILLLEWWIYHKRLMF